MLSIAIACAAFFVAGMIVGALVYRKHVAGAEAVIAEAQKVTAEAKKL